MKIVKVAAAVIYSEDKIFATPAVTAIIRAYGSFQEER